MTLNQVIDLYPFLVLLILALGLIGRNTKLGGAINSRQGGSVLIGTMVIGELLDILTGGYIVTSVIIIAICSYFLYRRLT